MGADVAEALKWYTARTRFGQELGIKKTLESLGVECFIPTDFVRNSRGKLVQKALVNNLVFLRTTKKQGLDLVNYKGLPMNYIIDCATHTLMVVPDKQMEDFIRVFDVSRDDDDDGMIMETIAPGSRVTVTKGPLKGVEGIVIEDEGKTYVAVGLDGLVYARARVPKAWISFVS